MSDTKLQIINITWRYDEQDSRYSPSLILFDHVSQAKQYIDLTDYKFEFILSDQPFCSGYEDFNGYHPCPKNAVVESRSYQQCYDCEQNLGFRSAFLFRKEPNENMQKYLSQKHYIYLAYFHPGKIKVGTAASSRKFIRPIEQDALIYAYIAENDGFLIQDLEHTISRRLQIRESVTSKSKLKHLGTKPDGRKAEMQINREWGRIKSAFMDDPKFSDWLFEKIEIKDLSGLEAIYYPDKEVNLLEYKDAKYLVGKFMGLRGRFTLFENDNLIMTFDERNIIGRYIEDYVSHHDYGVVSQPSDQQQLMI
jgi:hypothetical protein